MVFCGPQHARRFWLRRAKTNAFGKAGHSPFATTHNFHSWYGLVPISRWFSRGPMGYLAVAGHVPRIPALRETRDGAGRLRSFGRLNPGMSQVSTREQFRTPLHCPSCGAAGHAIWEENRLPDKSGPMSRLVSLSDNFVLQAHLSHPAQPVIACQACGTLLPD